MAQVDFSQISDHTGPEASPGFLLWRASTLWRKAIEAGLKPLNLTHPQFVILAATGWLTKGGEKASQVEIGRFAGLDPNTTSQILRTLEGKKLVKRGLSKDERSKNPLLTSTGAEVLSRAMPTVELVDADFFKALKTNELRTLQKLAGL